MNENVVYDLVGVFVGSAGDIIPANNFMLHAKQKLNWNVAIITLNDLLKFTKLPAIGVDVSSSELADECCKALEGGTITASHLMKLASLHMDFIRGAVSALKTIQFKRYITFTWCE